jgi:hypothetical protein
VPQISRFFSVFVVERYLISLGPHGFFHDIILFVYKYGKVARKPVNSSFFQRELHEIMVGKHPKVTLFSSILVKMF